MDSSTTNGIAPKNYLVESILVTIFCCLPLGIVGIINASKVNSAFENGDVEGANRAAAEAKKWVKYGFIAGLVVAVLYGAFTAITLMGVSEGV